MPAPATKRTGAWPQLLTATMPSERMPYSHYLGTIEACLIESYLESHADELSFDPRQQYVCSGRGNVRAVATWGPAQWETWHLGFECARLHYLACKDARDLSSRAEVVAGLRGQWRSAGVRYVFTQIDAADTSSIQVLEKQGFVTVDNLVLFARQVNDSLEPTQCGSATLGPAHPDDLPELRRLAAQSFHLGRFRNDPLISKAVADEMHTDWIESQVLHDLADHVLVARDEQGVVGFLTCAVDWRSKRRLGLSVGTIVLVAVDARARGRGIGRALLAESMRWFASRGVDMVEVGTQCSNVTAAWAYQSAGFKMVRASSTLRLYLEAEPEGLFDSIESPFFGRSASDGPGAAS